VRERRGPAAQKKIVHAETRRRNERRGEANESEQSSPWKLKRVITLSNHSPPPPRLLFFLRVSA
jgi:hypothetical protein